MILGMLCGLLSALFQSGSYVFSRAFMLKHSNRLHLLLYSLLLMGVFGLVLLMCIGPLVSFPWGWRFVTLLFGCLITFVIGQFTSFQALQTIESSRLASLLGIKIVVLAFIFIMLEQRNLSFLQWGAVLLSTIAAIGMNFTGGRLSLKGVCFLLAAAVSYSISDITLTEMIKQMPGDSIMLGALGVLALSYSLLGIGALPILLAKKCRRDLLIDALPYSLAWFGAMIFLYFCFGLIGVVFGNIIQATRGVISVALGAVLLHFGFEHLEPRVGRRAWVRRFIMAVLMVAAISLYSYSRSRG